METTTKTKPNSSEINPKKKNKLKLLIILLIALVILLSGLVTFSILQTRKILRGLNSTTGTEIFTNPKTGVSFQIPPGFAAYANHNGVLEPANPSDTHIFLCPLGGCGQASGQNNSSSTPGQNTAGGNNTGGSPGSNTSGGQTSGNGTQGNGTTTQVIIDPDPFDPTQPIDPLLEDHVMALFPGETLDRLIVSHTTVDGSPALTATSKDPNRFGNITAQVFVDNGHIISVIGDTLTPAGQNNLNQLVNSFATAKQAPPGESAVAPDVSVYAAGSGGLVYHYNGTSWVKMDAPAGNNYNGVWAFSDSDVFVVGDNQTILHYNGSAWSQMNLSHIDWRSGTSPAKLFSVTGTGGNNVFVSGQWGVILHYNGQAWRRVDNNAAQGDDLFAIWATDKGVYAAGYGGTILHAGPAGTNWASFHHSAQETYYAIYGEGDFAAIAGEKSVNNKKYGIISNCTSAGCFTTEEPNFPGFDAVWGYPKQENLYLGTTESAPRMLRAIINYTPGNWKQVGNISFKNISSLWGSGKALYAANYSEDSDSYTLARIDWDNWNAFQNQEANFTPQIIKTENKINAIWGLTASAFSEDAAPRTETQESLPRLESPKVGTLIPTGETGQTPTDGELPLPPVSDTKIPIPSGSSDVLTKTFIVDAAKNALCSGCGTALDTGMDISAGDTLIAHAEGKWDIGIHPYTQKILGNIDANGFTDSENVVNFGHDKSMPIGALAGNIGGDKTDNYIFIGQDLNDPVYFSGRLYLLCWDTEPNDNAGTMSVRITITRH